MRGEGRWGGEGGEGAVHASGRLRGIPHLTTLSDRVGALKKDLTRAWGGEVGRGGWGGSGAVGSELRSELSGCGII